MHRLDRMLLSKRLNYVVKNLDLQGVVSQKIDTLSRGYRQRVGLAAALIHNPQVLIMDEPTTGLDPNQQKEIRKLIEKIAKNKTIVFSTHILSEAQSICQRVIIIHRGRLVAKTNLADLKKKGYSLEKLFFKLTQEWKTKIIFGFY